VPIFAALLMKRLITILFLLLSFGFIVEQAVLHQVKASLELVQDDDTDKSADEQKSKVENDIEEKYHPVFSDDLLSVPFIKTLPDSSYYALLSSGYINKPYTPPDSSLLL
jgi:hypothetical protein